MNPPILNDLHQDHAKTLPAGNFGDPLPDHPHAVSVWMPAWQDVIDYEEGAARAKTLMKTGYPRFFYHQFYQDLCARYESRINLETQIIRIFPSEKSTRGCFAFAGAGEVLSSAHGAVICVFPKECEQAVKHYWQHAGAMISSRQAEHILKAMPDPDGQAAKESIKNQLSALYGGLPGDDIALYSNGMAAIFEAYNIVRAHKAEGKTIQLGFPYLDTLKIQEKFGQGCHFVRHDDFERLESLFKSEPIAAVFTEAPTNPLLDTADFKNLRVLLDHYDIPLVIDDTVGTAVNLNLRPYADIIVSSLTKFFCGSSIVCGGALVLNPDSQYYGAFKTTLAGSYEDLLYGADAIELARGGENFPLRMSIINQNAEILADALRSHPLVGDVYYPKFRKPDLYHALLREGGGYGGLLSFTLKDPRQAPVFYNALQVCKGPSLGTEFTLAVPYTMLAHYDELDKVEAMGVPRDLIRVSAGTENIDDVLARFESAFKACR